MKKALVLGLVLLFGFGIAATAQLSGYWSSSIAIDPAALTVPTFFTSLGSTLKVDYALSDWTFGSITAFDLGGFSSQKFSVGGALGAFTFASTLAFDPAFQTIKTYPVQSIGDVTCANWYFTAAGADVGPRFLTWDVTGSVSIAGVSFEAYVLNDQSHYDVLLKNYLWTATTGDHLQTDSKAWSGVNGMGWRLKVAGSFGAVNVTSYTYFNMTESFAKTTNGLTISKGGIFTVQADCDGNFVEEYVLLEGFTFGCASIDIGVKFTCTGFYNINFLVNNISLGGWATFGLQITFTTSDKSVATDIEMVTPLFDCIVLEVGFGTGAVGLLDGGNVIDKVVIHGVKLEQTWNGVKFTSITEFDAASMLMSTSSAYTIISNPADELVFIPYVGKALIGGGDATPVYVAYGSLYEAYCFSTERYVLWERFIIDVDADACCGGLFDLTVTTDFGNHETLTSLYYATLIGTATTYTNITWLYGTVSLPTVANASSAGLRTSVKLLPVWAAGNATLFDWARTNVVLSVGVTEDVTVGAGFNISAFGWESLSATFKWEF